MELCRPISRCLSTPYLEVPYLYIQVAVVESGRSLQYLHELLPRCH